MNFSNFNVETVSKHKDCVGFIYQFNNNEDDHFISISMEAEVVEWIWNREENWELSRCNLERPGEKFLINIGHSSFSGKKCRISKIVCFENKIVCGYEDGLILVWAQSVEKKRKIEEEEKIITDDDMEVIQKLNHIQIKKDKPYINLFNLDYIFIGHTQNIIEMFYLREKNYLVTSSREGVVKFFDIQQGLPLYHFNLDIPVSKILNYTDLKKNEIISLLSSESFKINLIINKQPFSFSTATFKNGDILDYEIFNKNFYCTSNKGSILVFDSTFNLINEFNGEFLGSFTYIRKWNNYFVLIGDDGILRLVDFNEKSKKIVDLFKIKIGNDESTSIFVDKTSNVFMVGSYDQNIYAIKMDTEFNLYKNRLRMREEERESAAYNLSLKAKASKKNKKSTSAKKKGKSKSKEKPASATSKKDDAKPKSASSKRSNSEAPKKGNALPEIKEKEKKPPSGKSKKKKK